MMYALRVRRGNLKSDIKKSCSVDMIVTWWRSPNLEHIVEVICKWPLVGEGR